jgi:hypothetical protein
MARLVGGIDSIQRDPRATVNDANDISQNYKYSHRHINLYVMRYLVNPCTTPSVLV